MEKDGVKTKLDKVSKSGIEKLIENKTIYGGMIPKAKAAIDGLSYNIPEVAIINGFEKNGLIDYINGKQIGTKIVLEEEIVL